MPQSCSICMHPSHGAIDEALKAGASYRQVAARYGVSKSSLLRHVQHGASPQHTCPCSHIDWPALADMARQLSAQMQDTHTLHDPYRLAFVVRAVTALLVRLAEQATEGCYRL